MRAGRPKLRPLYTLAHGVEVVGEYDGKSPHVMCRVRPHPFFSSPETSGGLYIRRSRVVVAAREGRALLRAELITHLNGDRKDDRPENLIILSAAEHNRHHKSGRKHREASKRKISAGLRRAYQEGRCKPPSREVAIANITAYNRSIGRGL